MTENIGDKSPRTLLAVAIVLVIVSIVFFANGVSLSSNGEIAAGLLSTLIGFALLASAITLFRLWGALNIQKKE